MTDLKKFAQKIYIASYVAGVQELVTFQVNKFNAYGKAQPLHIGELNTDRINLIESILKEVEIDIRHDAIVQLNRIIDNIDSKETKIIKDVRKRIEDIIHYSSIEK